jgi:hypothetical protein
MSRKSGKSVFVAAVSPEMSRFKENLIVELQNNGFVVGPKVDDPDEILNTPELLGDYDIAIHILSDNETIHKSTGKGIEEQQIFFSVQHYLSRKLFSDSKEEMFKIFAWHPKSRHETIFDEEHLSPHLRKIQQMEEVEFLRTGFEDFKYYLLKNLEQISPVNIDEQYIRGDNNQCIYFLFDKPDKQEATVYIEYLKKRGYVVYAPQFEGELIENRQLHTNYLKKFDLAVIFANAASVNWVNMKIMDILKSPGLGREKEIAGKAVFMPAQKAKMCPLVQRGFYVIEYKEDGAEDQIDGFLSKNLH